MIVFIPQDSPLHRVDARVKILYLLFFLFTLLSKQTPTLLVAFSLITLLLYVFGGISLARPFWDLGWVWLFVALPIPLHILINPQSGMYEGLSNSLFLLNILSINLLFIYTTEIKAILQALVFFKIPSDLAFMLTIAIRFLPLMQAELNRIRIAQSLRGYKLVALSPPFPLLIPLMHSSLRRAVELAVSLESRGFDPENIHVAVELELGAFDYLLLLLLPLALFIVF